MGYIGDCTYCGLRLTEEEEPHHPCFSASAKQIREARNGTLEEAATLVEESGHLGIAHHIRALKK